jgi:hypothetical protein
LLWCKALSKISSHNLNNFFSFLVLWAFLVSTHMVLLEPTKKKVMTSVVVEANGFFYSPLIHACCYI